MELGLFLILLVNIGLISATDWKTPAFTKPDDFPCEKTSLYDGEKCTNWIFEPENKIRTIYLKFEEEQKEPILIAYIHCTDCEGTNAPQIGVFTSDSGKKTTLGPEIKKEAEGNYSLIIKNRLDYETEEERLFKFTLILEGVSIEFNVKIDLIDIDDANPQITVDQTPCEIPENYDGETNCTYNIKDPDTNVLKNISFQMDAPYINHFEIKIKTPITNNEANAVLVIRANKSLDFETMPMYFFELTGEDAGGNQGKALIMIKVIDVNDRPPTWVKIFAMQSFEENEPQSFIVRAKDGDLGINDTILYSWKDGECHKKIKLVETEENGAIIEIEEIDRDTQEMEDNDNTITCTLIASEKSSDLFQEPTEVSFIIQDVNDNKPLITIDKSISTPIKLREEEFTTLNKLFAVNDIDQGNNAQFEVTLENTAGNILGINYTEPFQVIPNNGYKNWEFSMSVVNSTLLDYDANDDWHKFSLKINSNDKGDPDQQHDDKTINIELINLNDEVPIFDEKTNYVVEIPENATKETYILNVIAIDADIDDCVLYELPQGGNEYKLVPQKNESTTLYTARDNVFDYERVKSVYIQISAKDTLTISGELDNFHTVTKQITINVKDVNDEKPRISLPPDQISIKEHEPVGTHVKATISAEDPDGTAHLNYYINWENTRVSKEGIQSKDTSKFKDVFTIETIFPDINKKGYAEGLLTVNNKKTLDYEVFDTIFLNIQVEDIEQEINNGTDEGTLTISIIDINDNAPEFDMETIESEKIVTEESKIGLKIARIIAKDIDGIGYNKVSYYLEPRNKTDPGLVNIDLDTGELTVAGEIDADGPDYTFYLYYFVRATDDKFNTTEPIEIFIEDKNTKDPFLQKQLVNQIKIKEREATDSPEFVQKIDGKDWDRDEPHRLIKYKLDNEVAQLGNMFSIDEETGQVSAHGKIDWDNDKEMTINVLLEDNIGGSGKHNEIPFKFTVIITDIDNNPPVLPKPTEMKINAEEDTAIGFTIKEIIATDKDKPCTGATKIDYNILELKDSKGEVITDELFVLQKKVGDEPECKQIAELKIKKSLRGYYGKISIKIHAQNSETPENVDEQEYEINVGLVNYKPPKILNPADSVIILQEIQTAGQKLKAIDGTYIKDFEATDDQGEKFEMKFEPDNDEAWDDVFKIINKPDDEKNFARLTLTVDDPPNKEYDLNIKAYHTGRGDQQNFVTKKITVKFVDENQLPGFEIFEEKVKFEENETDITCVTFPPAKDPKCGIGENDNCLYITYYHIMNTEEKVNFKTDNSNKDQPQICLEQWLDREKDAYHTLTIIATNNPGPPPSVPNGYKPLIVTVEVIDINDNPPSFVQKLFKGSLADTNKINDEIVTLIATDPDTIDEGKLKYKILENTITVSDDSLNSIKNTAFNIVGDKIRNALQPTQAMQGYFLFQVQVLDSSDFYDIAEVKIHIISDANRVLFKFSEDVDNVKNKSKQIEEIFSKEFGYNCTIDQYGRKLNENETRAVSYVTEVKTHFIDNDDKPVEKEIITIKLEDLAIVGRLKLRLEDTGLTLIGVDDSNKEIDEIGDINYLLKILLIVVSIVLGTLCIILIVAFILRTRSLNKRLAAMTTNIFGSTKSDLNRIGISAPGTNRHAVEANPVWNEEIDKVNEYDTMSQASGGSDLIGVEDTPDFASYDYGRPSINPVMQQNLHKRSKRDNDDDDDDINSLPGSINNSTSF